MEPSSENNDAKVGSQCESTWLLTSQSQTGTPTPLIMSSKELAEPKDQNASNEEEKQDEAEKTNKMDVTETSDNKNTEKLENGQKLLLAITKCQNDEDVISGDGASNNQSKGETNSAGKEVSSMEAENESDKCKKIDLNLNDVGSDKNTQGEPDDAPIKTETKDTNNGNNKDKG